MSIPRIHLCACCSFLSEEISEVTEQKEERPTACAHSKCHNQALQAVRWRWHNRRKVPNSELTLYHRSEDSLIRRT